MASKMTTQHLEKLREELARVMGDMRALEGQRDGLLMAIQVVTDQPTTAPATSETVKKRHGPIKDIVLRLLSENAERGLVSLEIVDLAKAQGIELERNSVSSMLSRFKRDNIVEHKDGKYRIPRPFPHEIRSAA